MIALAAVALLGAAGVASAQRSGSPPRLAERGSVGSPVATAPLESQFGVLRRGAATWHPAVNAGYARSVGLNMDQARRVRAGVFVVPGAGIVCTVRERGAVVCTPNAAVGTDFLVEGQCRRVSVSGLVPDGVTAAVVRKRNGGTVSVGVTHNFVDVTVSVRSGGDVPTAVEYADAVYAVPAVKAC